MLTRVAVGAAVVTALLVAAALSPDVVGVVLLTFSVVLFAWAVVGLMRPDWVRIPNRMASVWI